MLRGGLELELELDLELELVVVLQDSWPRIQRQRQSKICNAIILTLKEALRKCNCGV